MNVAYFSPQITHQLRREGVKIWEVTDWHFKQDIHTFYLEADKGLPAFIPFNQRVIVKLISGEEKTIYLREEANVVDMKRARKLAKRLYKEYRYGICKNAGRDEADFTRWRDLSHEWKQHFIRAAETAIRGL
jgi:hypothetical protein